MLRPVLSSKENLKKADNRETKICCITRADLHHLTGVPDPDSSPATVKINVLQTMKGGRRLPSLHCYHAGFVPKKAGRYVSCPDARYCRTPGRAITSMMVALASWWQKLQQTTMKNSQWMRCLPLRNG